MICSLSAIERSISKICRPVHGILLNFNADLTFTFRSPWRNRVDKLSFGAESRARFYMCASPLSITQPAYRYITIYKTNSIYQYDDGATYYCSICIRDLCKRYNFLKALRRIVKYYFNDHEICIYYSHTYVYIIFVSMHIPSSLTYHRKPRLLHSRTLSVRAYVALHRRFSLATLYYINVIPESS